MPFLATRQELDVCRKWRGWHRTPAGCYVAVLTFRIADALHPPGCGLVSFASYKHCTPPGCGPNQSVKLYTLPSCGGPSQCNAPGREHRSDPAALKARPTGGRSVSRFAIWRPNVAEASRLHG